MTTYLGALTSADGDLIRFQVSFGKGRVGCTVSNEALEAAAGLVLPSTAGTRLKSFKRFRRLINAAALLKLGRLPADFAGSLALSGDDLRCVPSQSGGPVFGHVLKAT